MPEVACLMMLTAFSDDEALLASIMAGAAGYVLKQIRGCDLVGAVRVVASGRSLLDPRAAGQVMARLRDEAARYDRLGGLTARERKVLELIGDGLTNRQIGERLSVSVKTVKNYVSVLFVKLGMEQRTQAAAYAARVFDGRTPRRHRPGQRQVRRLLVSYFSAASLRCQASSVAGVTGKTSLQRRRGMSGASAASQARSAGSYRTRPTWRRSTAFSWRRTSNSASLDRSRRNSTTSRPSTERTTR